MQEAELLRDKLAGHPHIVAAHGVLQHAYGRHETTGIVLELAQNSLSSKLGQPLALHQRLRIAQECFSALHAAHVQGYAHLDIKPENILVWDQPQSSAFTTKVADWGFALPEGTLAFKRGTPGYTAPELLVAEQAPVKVDSRADVYSMGVMLLELAAHKRVWPAFHHDEVIISEAVFGESFVAATVARAEVHCEPQWLRPAQWCCHADVCMRPYPGQVLAYLQEHVMWAAHGQLAWRDDTPLLIAPQHLDMSVTVRAHEVLLL
ncbi:MAG: protein kinase [Akkermansiaceae bacterium]|nr:protein kinase [Akkermansiaceae bacterium]